MKKWCVVNPRPDRNSDMEPHQLGLSPVSVHIIHSTLCNYPWTCSLHCFQAEPCFHNMSS